MNEFLERRDIGSTGMQSARLGIGSTFNAPASVIEEAFDHGINYLYWGSVRQPEFARAMDNLSKRHRDELILTVQSYSDDPGSIEAEVEEALNSAGLDNFDFLLLGNRMTVPSDAYVEVFQRLKQKGKVRFMSLSSHNRPLIPTLLEEYKQGNSPYELLMFRYNAVHRGAEKDVFPFAQDGPRPGIVTYTATRWAHLLDPAKMPAGEEPVSARDCYRYSLSDPSVDLVCCGPANAAQMQEAISALERGPLESDERERIE
jgi:aryl-alcohol dehydrogenase-like predicted oxidoreductase